MNKSDAALVSQLQTGSKSALAELYQRYKRQVYIFGLRMLGDSCAAEDLVQSVFLKLSERSRQLKDPERFRGWLFTTLRHDCLTALHRRESDSLMRAEVAAYSDPTTMTVGLGAEGDLSQTLGRLLAELPENLREILILREYENFSYDEIAEITGVKVGLVKYRLFAARRKLAEKFHTAHRRSASHDLR